MGGKHHSEKDHRHRAQVDRDVAPATLCGRADGTVERPGCAVDGERQAVDRRARRTREAARVRLVTPVRDCEQERDVAQRQQQQRPPVDQRGDLPSSIAFGALVRTLSSSVRSLLLSSNAGDSQRPKRRGIGI